MTIKHAKLSPSSSARWLACTGSVKAEQGYKNYSNKAASDGTAQHEVADLCLKSCGDAEYFIGKTIEGVLITDDMADTVQKYLDYVRAFENEHTELSAEQRVDFNHLVQGGFGTLDAAVIDYDKRVCNIFDLKTGRIFVDAENNTQGQLYALGLLNELEFLDVVDTFVIHIVQPPSSNYSSWEISVDDLKVFGQYVERQAKIALSDNAPRTAGESQCMWCKAAPDCPTLFEHTQVVIGSDFDDLDADVLSQEQKRLVLDNKVLIERFIQAIQDDVERTLLDGGKFDGYKLVEGRSNRKYTDTAETYLTDKLGDDAYKKTLISLTAAEKLVDRDELSEHLYKPQGKPKLVPSSAKGIPLVDITDCFDKIS